MPARRLSGRLSRWRLQAQVVSVHPRRDEQSAPGLLGPGLGDAPCGDQMRPLRGLEFRGLSGRCGSAVAVRAAEEQAFDRSNPQDADLRQLKVGSTFGTGDWRDARTGRPTPRRWLIPRVRGWTVIGGYRCKAGRHSTMVLISLN
jgi:hypothetical protein